MNRKNRTLIVMLVAVAVASGASWFVYNAVSSIPVREIEVKEPVAKYLLEQRYRSTTGRTSITPPIRAAGMRAASSSAASRSSASMR